VVSKGVKELRAPNRCFCAGTMDVLRCDGTRRSCSQLRGDVKARSAAYSDEQVANLLRLAPSLERMNEVGRRTRLVTHLQIL
jgi:hypothetical protein